MKRLFANLIPSMYPTLPISIPATMAHTTNERFKKKKKKKKENQEMYKTYSDQA